MKEHKARKRFGQNFLQDTRIISDIVNAVRPQPDDIVIEIGPGLAAITEPLTQKLKQLHAIEIDRDIVKRLKTLPFAHKLIIHEGDVLQFDFHSIVGRKKIVGNLPYNISSPLLFRLSEVADEVIDMHFMLQKEVVDRITASPNSKEYGGLSVMIQYFCKPTFLFEVPPGSFNPPPKVTSAVFRLEPYAVKPIVAKNEKALARLVSHVFTQRRKTLRNSLKGMLVEEGFEKAGVDPMARPETLTLAQFVALADQMVD